MTAPQYSYAGAELELFREAHNWKRYVRDVLRPWLGARVLEVGAGIGGTTGALCGGEAARWVCLEPDADQCEQLQRRIADGELPACCTALHGSLAQVDAAERFDAILYMDVLEHIEDDRGELARAAALLAPGGHLIVLAPAHNWLYTPFDEAVGHYRRYSRAALLALSPPGLQPVAQRYLDSLGICLSLGNRLLLRKSMPSAGNIRFWDRYTVPLSLRLDPLFGYALGKSVLVVWEREQLL